MIDFSKSKNSVQHNIIPNRKGLITAEKMRETLDTLIDDTETNIEELSEEIEDVVKEQLTDIESDLSTIKETQTAQSGQISGLDGRVDTLETEYDSIDKIQQSMLSDVEQLGTDVKELKAFPLKKGTRGTNSVQQETSQATANLSTALGYQNKANGLYSVTTGYENSANGNISSAHGHGNVAENYAEMKAGKHSTADKVDPNTFSGASDLTLFKVGNGASDTQRHDALKIMQSGEMFIPDTKAAGDYASKPMIKIQDYLFFSWVGTQAEYDSIGSYNDNMFYFITDGEPGPAPITYPNNEIHYATIDNQPRDIVANSTYKFNQTMTSNKYDAELGHCVATFNGDIDVIPATTFFKDNNFKEIIWIPSTVRSFNMQSPNFYILMNCQKIEKVYFGNEFKNLTSLPQTFMYGLNALTEADLSGFTEVTYIGNNVLAYCEKLTTLKLDGLKNCTQIGNQFLFGAAGIETLDMTGLINVNTVGSQFLYGLTKLKDIIIRDDSRVLDVLQESFTIPKGYVYVPDSLVEEYKQKVDKMKDIIRPLSEYNQPAASTLDAIDAPQIMHIDAVTMKGNNQDD